MPGTLFGRPKTDVVVLDNGDRVTCEIKKLQRGKLTVKTDAFGTVSVKWSRVIGLSSDYWYQVELQSGARFIGHIALGNESGQVEIRDIDDEGRAVEIPRIIEIIPIEASFWSRIKGSVDAGFDFTQASAATTWSSSAALDYRVPRFEINVDFSSNIQSQEGADTVNRQSLQAFYSRYYQGRWYAAALGQAEKSQNQGLDFRGLFGGGVGRRLVQTNRSRLRVLSGAAFSREKFEDRSEYESNAELVGALAAETFRFDSPELDLSAGTAVYVNLKTAGRYRIQATGKARIEIVKNLYWSFSIYESYDSDPPSDTSRRNDFGMTTSLGWTFN
ncbi:MAG TPA: DUF481 domain-containing protein [Vicinamibacteria bacterium]|nr:DUF481 domain-containing protein [Vicinamibacteria bacterium]